MLELSLVMPCFNEEDALVLSCDLLTRKLKELVEKEKISKESRIYLIDDGSRDNTWALIESLSKNNNLIRGIKLSRNFGHQSALIAGLFSAQGDVVITIDADLQDDINAIEHMLDEHLKGSEIVYGVRENRESDSFAKRFFAETFYKILAVLGVDIIHNHADYRLMSRRAIQALMEYKEVNLYVRGIVPLIGFRASSVGYSRSARIAGHTKYTPFKMLSLAWEGVTSTSIAPLRLVTLVGASVFIASLLLSVIVLILRFTDHVVPGWTSIVLPILIIGGIQILCIGIIGEYLGKVYKEVKSRPRYLIEKKIGE